MLTRYYEMSIDLDIVHYYMARSYKDWELLNLRIELVISNRPRASRSSDFEITRAISNSNWTEWSTIRIGNHTVSSSIWN